MATKRVVDLVFLVDVTGSMGSCIDGLKESIDKFFQYLTNENENNLAIRDWRAKVVGFRDIAYDKDNWLVDNPFVTSAAEIHDQLASLRASGGGDEPESLLDALLTVADMEETDSQETPDPHKWRARRSAARAVVVFTDATYHEKTKLDKYPDCDYKDVAQKIGEKRIILEVVTPSEPRDRRVSHETFEECYEKLSQIDKAEYIPLTDANGGSLTFTDIPNHMDLFTGFIEQLARTLSASVDPVIL